MSTRKYNTKDNDLIWESFQNRVDFKQNDEINNLLENDLQYIEQFLIDEGLMDTVKKAAGGVKNFAQDKILKPLMDMLVNAIKKDPASAEKLPELQQAAQSGGDIGAILQKNGDQSIMKQIAQQPAAAGATATQAESYLHQFNMNSMICEALVEANIISTYKSQVIQERYYTSTIDTLFNEVNKPTECPWMPATVSINENKAIAQKIDQLAKSAPGGSKGQVFPQLFKINKTFQNFVKKQAQSGGAQPSGSPTAGPQPSGSPTAGPQPSGSPTAGPQPSGSPTAGPQPSGSPAAGPQPGGSPTAGPSGPPAQPGGGSNPNQGILGKIWSFVKANKGAIGGLAAMGIAAALISFGGPLIAVPATRYLTGALIGGVRGAIKGATSTEGGFADKLKGAANQAGADSMKGGAVGVVAGAAGDAVGSVMGGAANAAAAGEVPSAAAEPYVEPEVAATSDYGGEPEDYSAGGANDLETPEIGGTSGGFDPETGESNMDMSDEEAAAFNASQPMSDDEFNNLPSQGGMAFDAETGQELPTDANGEVPGRDYQEPTATSAAEAEAGVGTIDPVTGKEIEAIDPENKPNWRDKLKSLMPGGTKPREVFGQYTGKG